MAICYANNQVIHAEDHVGMLRTISYAGRTRNRCPISGKTYDWSHLKSDVLFRQVLLPDAAPEHFKDPPRRQENAAPENPAAKTQRVSRHLWLAVDQSERVFDRKTKVWRFRKRGQLAYRLILAAPANRPIGEVSLLVTDFLRETFVDEGVPAEAVIHKAEDEAGLNTHVHVTIATRVLGSSGFGLKARHLLPDFVGYHGKRPGEGWSRVRTSHEWPRRWAAFQNAWYERRGINVRVDPIAAEPGIHIGKWRDPEIEAERRAADEAKRIESAAIARDPERLLKVIEDQVPVFSLKDVLRHLRRNGVMGLEAHQIAQRLLALPEILALEPRVHWPSKEANPYPAKTRLYTTRSILEQEDRIHRNVEYLYADLAFHQPLPPGMKAHAERLIAEHTLDPEQAEAVRHTIEGPGIRVNQGVAGAGKSHLLATTRMVFEAFDYHVVAMAPTNMVAADLRKNGFDACTIHRFISDVKRGKRELGPNNVLVVDEAGMINTNLYDELTGIARQYGCRLVLSGDGRQLPPIGRGGVFSKIRHMVGDARLSRVRRQDSNWMKAASERLSIWDIRGGVGDYASQGAIQWNRTSEQAMYALVEQCARDLDDDPARDLSKYFVYCALNRSADVLNNEIQERIWRGSPAGSSYQIKCCRGKVRIRCGDRIQFHETDLKRGLFNGAIGTISSLDSQNIQVRLDSGEDVTFDPREFEGWGLGYAGTVHRGQGQTKLRSYVLYDSAYLWNAALTYVALTRHKQSTRLFVPRELAANQEALVEQMSQTVSQPLASDYAVVKGQQAQDDVKEALCAMRPPAAWIVADTDGRERELNLNLKADADEACSAFRRMPAPRFASAYRLLCTKAYDKPLDDAYESLRRAADVIASVRGFLPGNGRFNPRCLMGVFADNEREDHVDDPLLASQPDEMDVSPAVINPGHVEISLWQRLVNRYRELDEFVRDAIRDRLGDLRSRARPDSTLSAGLGAAQFLLRLCRITGLNAAPSDRQIKEAAEQEGAPREVFGALRFWRKVGPDDYEPVQQTAGIHYAFSGTALPRAPITAKQQVSSRQYAIPDTSATSRTLPAAAKPSGRLKLDDGPGLS